MDAGGGHRGASTEAVARPIARPRKADARGAIIAKGSEGTRRKSGLTLRYPFHSLDCFEETASLLTTRRAS